MNMTHIPPRPQAFASGRRVDAVEGEIFQSLDPATGTAFCETRIAAPERTSKRWQEPDSTFGAVTLP